MPTPSSASVRSPRDATDAANASARTEELEAALLTGGFDKPYAFGLATALKSQGVRLDVVGSDEVDSPEYHGVAGLTFLNLRPSLRPDASLVAKAVRVLVYYSRLVRYALTARPKIFHILWNNKFHLFDRTLLMLYYKMLGKKVVFTAHNVNAGKRDSNDSLPNRIGLRIQYFLADHIFVHTEKMQRELIGDFGVPKKKTSVIPFGINNSVPHTNLNRVVAKQRLGIKKREKAILFFGGIRPYKGLEYLVEAFQRLLGDHPEYRLIIAGHLKADTENYWSEVQRKIERGVGRDRIIQHIGFIPDEETELYFKAADVLVLPYTYIFQSGVLFLAFGFGLPVVATDVGTIREEVIDGRTGFLCRPCDAADLARALETYFESDLFRSLDCRRRDILDYANATHSWELVGEKTRNVYSGLLRANSY